MKIDSIRKAFAEYSPTGENGNRHFSVLVPVTGTDPELIYEVRASKLDRQPGEICFPGGLIEEGETPLQCAVRETGEEIGISPEDIEVITEIDSIFSTSGSQIHCFIGIVRESGIENLNINEDEVAEVFTVPVKKLMETKPEVYTNRLVQEPAPDFPYERVTGRDGYPWRNGRSIVPVYDVNSRIIWGLTGRITKQFLEILREGEQPCSK